MAGHRASAGMPSTTFTAKSSLASQGSLESLSWATPKQHGEYRTSIAVDDFNPPIGPVLHIIHRIEGGVHDADGALMSRGEINELGSDCIRDQSPFSGYNVKIVTRHFSRRSLEGWLSMHARECYMDKLKIT